MKKHLFKLFGSLIIVILAVSVYYSSDRTQQNYQPLTNDNVETQSQMTEASSIAILRRFDLIGDGYHLLYEALALPNTVEQAEPPNITDYPQADAVIRRIATERGYQLQRISLDEADLISVGNSQILQRQAATDWQKLKAEAAIQGISLRAVSGFRTIEFQRNLFMGRLISAGVAISKIGDSSQDSIVSNVLAQVAPPGYSRHHTGYTIDVGSADSSVFEQSKGYAWLSADNYTKALKYGFIPSYPKGAAEQGPEPESWEFVWVGEPLIEAQVKPANLSTTSD